MLKRACHSLHIHDSKQNVNLPLSGIGTFWLLNSTTGPSSLGSPSQYLHCDEGFQNALTHTDLVFSRRKVEVHWQAPQNFTGFVRFR